MKISKSIRHINKLLGEIVDDVIAVNSRYIVQLNQHTELHARQSIFSEAAFDDKEKVISHLHHAGCLAHLCGIQDDLIGS
jgi:hypothetical protein